MKIPKTPKFDVRALVRKKVSPRDALFLWLVHKGEQTAAALAEKSGTERRLACISVNGLLEKKLLSKSSSKKDKRIHVLKITKAGTTLLENLA